MKLYKFLLLLFFLLLISLENFAAENSSNSSKETDINYLFIEWRHWNNTVVLGHFSENKLKRIEETVCDVNDLDDLILNRWLKDSIKAVLFSFHCMWGQQSWFHRLKYLNSFAEVLSNARESNIRTVVSFIWHAGGINYKKNWSKADSKGEPLGKFLAAINHYYNFNSYVFCHSMGSRFFQGVLKSMPEQQNVFKALILFSADLPADINRSDFKRIQIATGSIAVFKHEKDKMLLLSSVIFKNKRLGRNGPLPLTAMKGVTVFDMTGRVKGFQNHAHINKKWPKIQMSEFLSLSR